ncbi:MAG: hypothetical protein RIR79_1066 [Pseudomonadota bacterium]|jgi:hypothetical protein
MKTPIASIFIAILVVATDASAQDAKNPPKPQQVAHHPVTASTASLAAPTATRNNVQLTQAEQERVDRLGGQPLQWLKTMAAHEANRKAQAGTPDKKVQAKSR